MKIETVRIDMRGQICPSTLIIALREINRLQQSLRCGACILAILSDNRHATFTVPQAAENMGYEVRVEDVREGYLIRIAAPGCLDRSDAGETA